MIIEGEMYIGEASKWAGHAMKPLTGSPWPMIIANLAAGVFAIIAIFGYGILNELGITPSWGWLPWILAVCILSVIVGNRACRAWMVPRFRDALVKRGVPNPLPTRLELGDEHLVLTSGEFVQSTPWRTVSEVLEAGPYWVILAQAAPFFIAKRMMDDGGEQAFLTELSHRISPEALERSSPKLRHQIT